MTRRPFSRRVWCSSSLGSLTAVSARAKAEYKNGINDNAITMRRQVLANFIATSYFEAAILPLRTLPRQSSKNREPELLRSSDIGCVARFGVDELEAELQSQLRGARCAGRRCRR